MRRVVTWFVVVVNNGMECHLPTTVLTEAVSCTTLHTGTVEVVVAGAKSAVDVLLTII